MIPPLDLSIESGECSKDQISMMRLDVSVCNDSSVEGPKDQTTIVNRQPLKGIGDNVRAKAMGVRRAASSDGLRPDAMPQPSQRPSLPRVSTISRNQSPKRSPNQVTRAIACEPRAQSPKRSPNQVTRAIASEPRSPTPVTRAVAGESRSPPSGTRKTRSPPSATRTIACDRPIGVTATVSVPARNLQSVIAGN